MQVVPLTQPVAPFQFCPPHWPHFGTVPEVAEDVVARVVLVDDATVDVLFEAIVAVTGLLVDILDETTTAPGPATVVVRLPLST